MSPFLSHARGKFWATLALLGLTDWSGVQAGGLVTDRRHDLSASVQVDRADATAVRALEQARAYLDDKQFEEGINLLLATTETAGEKLVAVAADRYWPLRLACQSLLTSMPPEGLALYRRRVDVEARRLFEEGVARRDARRLRDVVERYLASSWADSALDALGEIALESGDASAARAFWQRIVPVAGDAGRPAAWLGVPDTDLDLAAIRARLVLASIMEGSRDRAADELAQFVRLHPDARGWFGGREVRYADALTDLLAESAQWQGPRPMADWPTFAGVASRNAIAAWSTEATRPIWRVALTREQTDRQTMLRSSDLPGSASAGELNPLSTFPVVAAGRVFVNLGNEKILAWNLADGRPAWGQTATVFADELETERAGEGRRGTVWGVPRFTATVVGERLFAQMGPPLTSRPREASRMVAPGYLICLDLASEGRLAWKVVPEPGWAFDGSPVADAAHVYVAMRRSEVQSQVHVACYAAENGELRWRRFLCSADSPGKGMLPEITHNLLTLHRDTLFLNTNLGAVAALDARTGTLRWLTIYPRSVQQDRTPFPEHAHRDLTPCLYDRGVLYVAPADARSIFALDADSGQILWQSGPEFGDVVHLLGVSHDCLIASGGRLFWIHLTGPEQGRLKYAWPDGGARLGYGRGLLAGKYVLWPTRKRIYQFDRATGKLLRAIDLESRGLVGGNLITADGKLLIASARELVVLGTGSANPPGTEDVFTVVQR